MFTFETKMESTLLQSAMFWCYEKNDFEYPENPLGQAINLFKLALTCFLALFETNERNYPLIKTTEKNIDWKDFQETELTNWFIVFGLFFFRGKQCFENDGRSYLAHINLSLDCNLINYSMDVCKVTRRWSDVQIAVMLLQWVLRVVHVLAKNHAW